MRGQGEPDEAKVASFKQQLNTNLDVYEKILSKQSYLAGDVNIIILNKIFDFDFLLIIYLEFYFGRFISFALWCMAC